MPKANLSYIAKHNVGSQKKLALSYELFHSLTYATLISGAMKERSVSSGLPEPPLVPPLPPQHLFFQRRRDLPKANLSYIAKHNVGSQKKLALSYELFHSLTYATLISGAMKERSVNSGLLEPTLQFQPVKEPGSL